MAHDGTRTALITGGTRGIGLATSATLGREGYNIVVTGRRKRADVSDALAVLGEAVQAGGTRVLYAQSDVADLAAHKQLLQTCLKEFGSVDVLVNNAGVAPDQRVDLLEASPESYDRVMSINLRGPYFLTQTVARQMVTQIEAGRDAGSVINISSISAVVASPNRGEYCVSKAGQSMASQLWAVRLGEFGIGVFDIRPGIIRTDMTEGVIAKYNKLIDDGLTLERRLGEPEDVARAVATLARGDLPYSTGQVIYIDGGMLIQRL